MKKGIVLIISLFFITAISLLVLKNLDDTDTFFKKQRYIEDNTQLLISIKDFQKELGKLLKQNKKSLDEVLESEIFEDSFIDLNIKELTISFKIKKYDKININDINTENSITIRDYFTNNNVFNYDYFKDIYKEKFPNNNIKLDNNKQMNDIINTFILRSYSKDILKIKDELGFFEPKDLYELDIKANFNSASAIAYYVLSKEGEVKYFDVSFN